MHNHSVAPMPPLTQAERQAWLDLRATLRAEREAFGFTLHPALRTQLYPNNNPTTKG